MRFRPTGGIGSPKAAQARTDAISEQSASEEVFDTGRHTHEIEQAENRAAGLPPEGLPAPAPETSEAPAYKKEFREPNLETPAEVNEEFTPVHVPENPQGLVESIRVAANKVIKKVQRLIKPIKRVHKEVIINAESLETRVAVLEDGKLEEFTIERTSDERLVGSIFKGKVKN
ncbi:MAG: Rne/Rng family ribonuclease, partial [Verrucomicrobiota bacterium]